MTTAEKNTIHNVAYKMLRLYEQRDLYDTENFKAEVEAQNKALCDAVDLFKEDPHFENVGEELETKIIKYGGTERQYGFLNGFFAAAEMFYCRI